MTDNADGLPSCADGGIEQGADRSLIDELERRWLAAPLDDELPVNVVVRLDDLPWDDG